MPYFCPFAPTSRAWAVRWHAGLARIAPVKPGLQRIGSAPGKVAGKTNTQGLEQMELFIIVLCKAFKSHAPFR